MITWSHAYHIARKGIWEQVRRDDERFRHRIQSSASILNPILDENHRSKAWNRIQAWNQAALSSHVETSTNWNMNYIKYSNETNGNDMNM